LAFQVKLGLCVAALLLLSSAAYAQPVDGACAGFTPPPALPDGQDAGHAAMLTANEAIEAWRVERDAKMTACRAEIDAMRTELNSLEHSYNQAGAERNSALAAWNAEVAEYTMRGRGRAVNRGP
jgi:hypothetical protein